MSAPREQKLDLDLGGATRKVHALLREERLEVRIDGGSPRSFEARSPAPGEVLLRDEAGRLVRALVVRGPGEGELSVAIDGRVARLTRKDARSSTARSHHAHDTALEAPMPGTCRDVFVKPGDKVEKGARLVLIEAMKMEHELRAPRAGVVKTVRAKKGAPVAPGEALVELE